MTETTVIGKRLVGWIVPLLMLIAAVAHGWRVNVYDESPWIGAGFGMFAEIDGPQRAAQLELVGGETVTGPGLSSTELAKASNFPTEASLKRLVDSNENLTGVLILRPIFSEGDVSWEEIASYGVD